MPSLVSNSMYSCTAISITIPTQLQRRQKGALLFRFTRRVPFHLVPWRKTPSSVRRYAPSIFSRFSWYLRPRFANIFGLFKVGCFFTRLTIAVKMRGVIGYDHIMPFLSWLLLWFRNTGKRVLCRPFMITFITPNILRGTAGRDTDLSTFNHAWTTFVAILATFLNVFFLLFVHFCKPIDFNWCNCITYISNVNNIITAIGVNLC